VISQQSPEFFYPALGLKSLPTVLYQRRSMNDKPADTSFYSVLIKGRQNGVVSAWAEFVSLVICFQSSVAIPLILYFWKKV